MVASLATSSRRGSEALVGLLALAVVATGCTFASDKEQTPSGAAADGSSVVKVAEGQDASLSTDSVTISIPGSSLTGRGTLAAQPGLAHDDLPAGMSETGPGVDVTLEGARLTGPAKVRFNVPAAWSDQGLVPVVVWEDPNGWQWLPTTVTEDGKVAVAEAAHFSGGFLGGFDPAGVAQDAFNSVRNYVTGRSGVAQPACAGEDWARQTVMVSSDNGDSVKWCLGREGGRTVLKIANNRLLYTQVSYPDRWTNLTGAKVGLSLDRALVAVGTSIEQLAYRRARRTVFLLEPGATMTIAVPEGAADRVTAKATPAAFFLQTLRTALEMVGTVTKFAKVGANAPAADKVFAMLGEGSGDRAAWADAAQQCLVGFTDTFTDDMTEPITGPGQLRKVAEFTTKCGAEIGSASISDSGPLAWLATATMATVINVYSLASSLVTQLIGAGREIFDGIRSLTTNVDDAAYDITIAARGIPTALVGTYYVHGGSLEVYANGTARGSDSYCFVDAWAAYGCTNVTEFDVDATGATSLRLTVTREYAESSFGERVRNRDPFVRPGDYYTLQAREPGFYLTRLYRPDGTPVTGPGEANNLGNPWLCRSDRFVDDSLSGRCGA
jgi:hypothetical protein